MGKHKNEKKIEEENTVINHNRTKNMPICLVMPIVYAMNSSAINVTFSGILGLMELLFEI